MLAYSEKEAYDLYNNYAYNKGFSIRKGNRRFTKIGECNRHVFLCSKEGYREFEDPHEVRKINRIDSRCGCPARAIFKVEKGVYELDQIISEHNHPFVEPKQKHLLRSARTIHDASGSVIKSLTNAGIRTTKTYSYLAKEAGGFQNIGFTEKDCHNYIQAHRRQKIAAGDGQSVLIYFKRKQAEDPMFFYTVQVDEENRMSNFFWSDSSSRLDYDCFGDVVIFDTTYRINKYNMICAPFVGVNHHWKNVFFGCAFLLDEMISSFVWLFDAFLQSMGNKALKTIFTDQDQAMANAIAQVFPNTQHRLCQWYIFKNAAQNISHLYHQPGFRDMFNKLFYSVETENEFEATWNEMIDKWGAADEKWLHRLYELRCKWALAFSRDIFSAEIRSTQRSESTNNVFQQMACKTMTLTEFVQHYEEKASKMHEAELKEDYDSARGKPRILLPNNRILKHASNIYTHKIFGMFQKEFLHGLAEIVRTSNIDGTVHTYKLKREGGRREHIVQFDSFDCSTMCSCKKFESRGWSCAHTLRVLHMETGVEKIPAQYILNRWTKGAKEGTITDKVDMSLQNSANSSKTMRFNMLIRKSFGTMNLSANDDTTTEIAEANLDWILEQVRKHMATLNCDHNSNPNEAIADTISNVTVLDPPRKRPKGVTYRRLKDCLEKRKKKASKRAPTISNAHAPQTHDVMHGPLQETGYASHTDAPQPHNHTHGPSQVTGYASHAHASFSCNVMPGPSNAPVLSVYGHDNDLLPNSSQTSISNQCSSNNVMGSYITPHFQHWSQDGVSSRSEE